MIGRLYSRGRESRVPAKISCDSVSSSTMRARTIAPTMADQAAMAARQQDAAVNGLYSRVWCHLRDKGLVGKRGDKSALYAEMQKMRNAAASSLRRARITRPRWR